jgi:type IV secretory pathway protease TraF
MGDNRQDSCDSRYWGPIAKSLIVGKVLLGTKSL